MRKLILILLLACSACGTQARDPGRKDMQAAASGSTASAANTATLARIRTLAGDAACVESSQCRTLALGARPCGGPENYLPYSVADTDEKALRALGEQYKAERQATNKAGDIMSICQYLADPGAICTAGKCQLNSSTTAPTAR